MSLVVMNTCFQVQHASRVFIVMALQYAGLAAA